MAGMALLGELALVSQLRGRHMKHSLTTVQAIMTSMSISSLLVALDATAISTASKTYDSLLGFCNSLPKSRLKEKKQCHQ